MVYVLNLYFQIAAKVLCFNGHLFLLERVLSDRDAMYFEKPYLKLTILKIKDYTKNAFRLKLSSREHLQLLRCSLLFHRRFVAMETKRGSYVDS